MLSASPASSCRTDASAERPNTSHECAKFIYDINFSNLIT